ncbi:MAG: polyhydroxyalkanoate synthesis regulator DNA-binding domain-containing protein [Myxococcota bacterium]
MGTKVIKRYSNRKLYDTDRSRYVTLDEISEMVKAGEDVQILDNKTGVDLTSVTLTQIIYEDQKKINHAAAPASALPLVALRSIIQSGGAILQKLGQPVTKMSGDIKRRAEKLEENRQEAIREFIDGAQQTFKDIDDRVRGAMDQMTHIPDLRRDLNSMQDRVTQMERQIRTLSTVIEELAEAQRRQAPKPDSLPGQKSNPTLPL